MRQSWCARDASWGRADESSGFGFASAVPGFEIGMLHTSQRGGSWRTEVGDEGADWVSLGVSFFSSFGRTIERYLFAMLFPDGVEGAVAEEVVVLSSCSEDRTKGTRFLRIPAPKTRWSSSGTK